MQPKLEEDGPRDDKKWLEPQLADPRTHLKRKLIGKWDWLDSVIVIGSGWRVRNDPDPDAPARELLPSCAVMTGATTRKLQRQTPQLQIQNWNGGNC